MSSLKDIISHLKKDIIDDGIITNSVRHPRLLLAVCHDLNKIEGNKLSEIKTQLKIRF